MKKLNSILLVAVFFSIISSCATKTIDVKSPCVSNDGGPCGPKRPINDWWIKNTNT